MRVAYTTDGTWLPHPTYQEGDLSTFELVVAGRAVGDDIAIMMVEAGGTEKAFDYYDGGAPFVTEDVVADGLEQAKTWIRESIELQLELVKKAGTREPMPFESGTDYGDDVFAAVEKAGKDSLAKAHQIVDKTERNAADKAAVAAIVASSLAERTGGRRPRAQSHRHRYRLGSRREFIGQTLVAGGAVFAWGWGPRERAGVGPRP